MPNPIVINPSANLSTPVSANCSMSYNIDNEHDLLNVNLHVNFVPFDFRRYKWTLFSTHSTGHGVSTSNEKLNWIKCTIYNYVPFAICRANTEGLYSSFEDAEFEEVHGWNFGAFRAQNVRLLKPERAFESNLKDKAIEMLNPSDDWFNTNQMGMTYNFSYGLNCNKFFGIGFPPEYNNFDNLLLAIQNGESIITGASQVWEDVSGICKATLPLSVSIADDGEHRTYAVLFANPATRQITTKFIPVIRTEPELTTKYIYVPNSLSVNGDEGKLTFDISQASDMALNVNISKTTGSSNWTGIHPRITFRVKKIVE